MLAAAGLGDEAPECDEIEKLRSSFARSQVNPQGQSELAPPPPRHEAPLPPLHPTEVTVISCVIYLKRE